MAEMHGTLGKIWGPLWSEPCRGGEQKDTLAYDAQSYTATSMQSSPDKNLPGNSLCSLKLRKLSVGLA